MFLFSVINFLTTKILNYGLLGDKVSVREKFLFTATTVDNWNYNFLGLILIGQAHNSSPQIGISLFSMAPLKHISFYIGNICLLNTTIFYLLTEREVNVFIRPLGYCETVITFSFSDWLLTNICWSLIQIFF